MERRGQGATLPGGSTLQSRGSEAWCSECQKLPILRGGQYLACASQATREAREADFQGAGQWEQAFLSLEGSWQKAELTQRLARGTLSQLSQVICSVTAVHGMNPSVPRIPQNSQGHGQGSPTPECHMHSITVSVPFFHACCSLQGAVPLKT